MIYVFPFHRSLFSIFVLLRGSRVYEITDSMQTDVSEIRTSCANLEEQLGAKLFTKNLGVNCLKFLFDPVLP